VLHLPMDEMALLDRDETAAIIGHELGHFCGADTQYSERFLPIYAGIRRSLDTVTRAGTTKQGDLDPMMLPAHALGNWCMDRFHEAVMHWSRIREFEADKIGSTIAGTQASASALVRTLANLAPIHTVFARVRTNPRTAPEDLVQEVRRVAAQDGTTDPDLNVESQRAHPTDSHPPTAERLLAFGETLPMNDALRQRALRPVNADGPVWYAPLFADASGVCRTLTRDYVAAVGEAEAKFDEILDTIASKAQATKELTERTIFSILLMVLLAVVTGGFGVALITSALFKQQVFAACMLLVAAACLYGAYVYWRRGQSPIMQLAANGFTLHGSTARIPWSKVDNISFMQVQQVTTTTFLLEEGFVPSVASANWRRVRWKAKKRTLTLAVNGMKGFKPQQYADLLVEYYQAGHARALLGAREAARDAV
jgi:Peptidase family M48